MVALDAGSATFTATAMARPPCSPTAAAAAFAPQVDVGDGDSCSVFRQRLGNREADAARRR
jgi:hypothetical protein